MGIRETRIVAFIYVTSMLAAVAPPINLWVMLMCAQANMPYVGFDVPLLAPIAVITVFTVFYLLRGGEPKPKDEVLASLPVPPEGMTAFRIATPLVVLILLLVLSKYAAFYIPILGIPLIFIISTAVAMLLSPRKLGLSGWYGVLSETSEQVFPLLATVISVGVLVNIMAATGVRGLIAITFVTLPVRLIYAFAPFVLPFAQGALSYSSGIILGTPLIFLFNSIGVNVTIVATALSLIFPLGDCLPPSRISGRVAIEVSGYKGSYLSFLRSILVPAIFMGLVAVGMLIYANDFKWLIFN